MKQLPPYTVIFADENFIVLNKRSGLLVAADRFDETAPRLDVLAEKEFGKLFAVHRIDCDTSGAIIYARTAKAHKHFSKQFENREVKKIYHCLVYGRPTWQSLHVDLPLLPDADKMHRTKVNRQKGKPSVTDFSVIKNYGAYTWLEAKPLTGRTHQIRAHLAANDTYIVCDPLYSRNQKPIRLSDLKRRYNGDTLDETPLLSRLALHAYEITVTHPESGEQMTFTAPYSKDMEATRKQLEKIYR